MFNDNTAPAIMGSNEIDNPHGNAQPSRATDTDDPVRAAIKDASGELTGVAPVVVQQIVEVHPLPTWMRTEFELRKAANGKFYARPKEPIVEAYTAKAPNLFATLMNWLPQQTDISSDVEDDVRAASNAGLALAKAMVAAREARTLDPSNTTEADRGMKADLDRVTSKAGWLLMGQNELCERADYLTRTNTVIASDQRFSERKKRFFDDALGFVVELIACREAYGADYRPDWSKGVKNALWYKANQHNRPSKGSTEDVAEVQSNLANAASLLGF